MLGLLHGLRSEIAEHRLAERHRLEREDPVPAGVQLVDDDVGSLVAPAGLVVPDPLDDVELDIQALAGCDDVLRPLAAPARRGVEDDRPVAILGRRRQVLPQVEPGRHDVRVGHPAERVVGADDPGIGSSRIPKLLRGLASNVRAEEVEHRFAPGRLEDRPLELARHQRPAEVEVKDVGLRQQPEEGRPLYGLAPPEAAGPVERQIGLRMELLALDDDEPGVDALAAQRLHVRPRDPRHVQRGVDYSEGSSHSTWSK